MQITNDYYLIVDLEATCSDDGTVPRGEMEIIEIGAVMQNSRTFEIDGEFQTFVRPVRHPVLTQFCSELTGINQQAVSSAPVFPAALQALSRWNLGFGDALFCSWGDYDRNQFQQDCEFHSVEYPFPTGHLNLKAQFALNLGLRRKFGIIDALRRVGLDFEGTHHRGLDDARNIARLVRRVLIGA